MPVTNKPLIRAIIMAVGAALFMLRPAEAVGIRDRSPVISGAAQIVDGDTLRIGPVSIRLHGIDAPEAGQSCSRRDGRPWNCGQAATDGIAALIGRGAVECEPLDVDRYGRIVARCRAGETDIGAQMVAQGLAWAFRRYSGDYTAEEASARADGRGIWQGAAQPAWDYRADRWSHAAGEAEDGCPIKGNISAKGEKIYHTPWSPAYGRTRIDPQKGERWFCDEAEAVAAGWRAARWR